MAMKAQADAGGKRKPQKIKQDQKKANSAVSTQAQKKAFAGAKRENILREAQAAAPQRQGAALKTWAEAKQSNPFADLNLQAMKRQFGDSKRAAALQTAAPGVKSPYDGVDFSTKRLNVAKQRQVNALKDLESSTGKVKKQESAVMNLNPALNYYVRSTQQNQVEKLDRLAREYGSASTPEAADRIRTEYDKKYSEYLKLNQSSQKAYSDAVNNLRGSYAEADRNFQKAKDADEQYQSLLWNADTSSGASVGVSSDMKRRDQAWLQSAEQHMQELDRKISEKEQEKSVKVPEMQYSQGANAGFELLDKYDADIKALQQERQEYADYVEFNKKYGSIKYEKDFDKFSRYQSTVDKPFHFDTLYEYVNGNTDAYAEASAMEGADSEISVVLKQMTEDEKGTYNYLYAKKGSKAASTYLKELRSALNARNRALDEQKIAEFSEKHPITATVGTIAVSPLKGFGYIGQAVDYLTDGKVDQNAPYNRLSYGTNTATGTVAQKIERELGDKWGKVGSFGYQTGVSMLNFLTNLLVSKGIGAGYGLGSEAVSNLSLALMGSGAAADTVISAKDRGLSDSQAFTLGTIAGAAEIVTEKVSVEALLDKVSLGENKLWYFLKNTLSEGSEEVGSDIINLTADVLISKDKSEWSQAIKAYREQNPKATEGEAFAHALADQAQQMGLDFLGGAASGGIMAGGALAVNGIQISIENRSMYKDAVQNGKSYYALNQLTRGELARQNGNLDIEQDYKNPAKSPEVMRLLRQEGLDQSAIDNLIGRQNAAAEYSIDPKFAAEIDNWDKSGRPEGERFILGSTGDVLQGLGAIENDIYMNSTKARDIVKKHPEMTMNELKRIPEILDDPVMVLKSRSKNRDGKNSRLVIFGSVKDQKGAPVLSVLDLRPIEGTLVIDDMQQMTSAYGKDKNVNSLFSESEVLYADEKRATALLRHSGIKGTGRLLRYGSMGSISYDNGKVNIEGVPFSDIVKTENLATLTDEQASVDTPKASSGTVSFNTGIPNPSENVNGKSYLSLRGLDPVAAGQMQRRMAAAKNDFEKSAVRWNVSPEKANTVSHLRGNVEVVFDGMLKGNVNGYYQDGVIHLNPSLSSNQAVLSVFGHELTHSLEKTGAYQDFMEFSLSQIGNETAVRNAVNEKIELYRRNGVELDTTGAVRELVAEYASERLFSDEQTVRRLAQEKPSLARRILTWVKEQIAKLKDDTAKAELLRAERLYSRMLSEAVTSESGTGIRRNSIAENQAVDRAIEMLDNGSTASEVYGQTGLVVTADGGIYQGIGGEKIGEWQNGRAKDNEGRFGGSVEGSGAENNGRRNRKSVAEPSEMVRFQRWASLNSGDKQRIVSAVKKRMSRATNEGAWLLDQYGSTDAFAERFYSALQNGRAMAEQWSNFIPDVQGLMGEIERISSGEEGQFSISEDRESFTPERLEEGIEKAARMDSVANITGVPFEPGKGLREKVLAFIRSQAEVRNSELGEVAFTGNGLRSDISHGMGPEKAASYLSVPEVIRQGQVVDYQRNWKGRGYDTAVIVAPVTMNGEPFMEAVVLTRSLNENRFYLHEVLAEKEGGAIRSTAGAAKATVPNSGNAPSINTILQRVIDVKRNGTGKRQYSISENQQGKLGKTYTESGGKIGFRYAVVDASDLVVSHDETGAANRNYPAELQPRDRSRESSKAQIQSMSQKLNPALLADSPTAQNGAPIVRADNVVVSGNGRSAAIVLAYEKGTADGYRAYLQEHAGEFGLDANKLPPNPILVRVAESVENWAELAKKLNESSVQSYSATEQAMIDAEKMGDILELLDDNTETNYNTRDNRDFIQSFLNKIAAPSEQNALRTADGLLSQAGMERVQNAVFAKAYGSVELSQRLSESLDNDSKNITNALMKTAARAAQLRQSMADGTLKSSTAVEDVVEGVKYYLELKEQAKSQGTSIRDILDQGSLFDTHNEIQTKIALLLDHNKSSGKNIKEFFSSLYDRAAGLGDPKQISMFGETENGEQNYFDQAINGWIAAGDGKRSTGFEEFNYQQRGGTALFGGDESEGRRETGRRPVQPSSGTYTEQNESRTDRTGTENEIPESSRGQEAEADRASQGVADAAPSEPAGSPKKKISQVRENTFENSSDIFTKADLAAKEMKRESFAYDVATEQASMQEARERLAADYEAEVERVRIREAWRSTDLDSAMEILRRKNLEARETGDFAKVAEWAKLIQEKGTNAGQMIQAFAKYTRTPEGILTTAARNLQKLVDMGEMETDTMNDVLHDMAEFTETLDTIEEGNEGGLVDLIIRLAKRRNTKVSNGTLKRLLAEPDFHYLYDFALTQMENIAADFEPVSFGRKLSTFQTIAHLLNIRTGMRNVISNQMFDLVDSVANNISLLPDLVLRIFTGQRTVGFEKSWASKAKRQGAKQGLRRGALEISLDVEPHSSDGKSKYGTGGRRTWKAKDSRVMTRLEKAMGYELNVTDEFHKGSVRREVLESLQKFVDNGMLTQEEALNFAEQEALYRSFQDNTLPGALLADLKGAMNLIGIGDSGKTLKGVSVKEFGLGDFVQKYTQVPGALISRAVEFSPLGYVKAIATLAQGARQNWRRAKALTLPGGKVNRIGTKAQRQAALAIGRATTGTGLITAFAALAASGILRRGDDEKDKDVSALNAAEGVGGTQINLSAIGRLLNGEKPEWRSGDVAFDLGFLEPLNAAMTLGSMVAQDASDKGYLAKLTDHSFESLFMAIKDTPTMQTMDSIYSVIQYHDDETDLPTWLEIPITVAESGITGFVPSLVRQIAQATDQNYRDQYSSQNQLVQIGDKLKNTIPGLRQTLPEKLDNFGRPKTYSNPWLNAFNATMFPGNMTIYKQDDVSKELTKIYQSTGNSKIYPDRSAPYQIRFGEESVPLAAEDRAVYQKTRGSLTKTTMADLMQSEAYREAGNFEKAELLKDAVDFANDLAKREFAQNSGRVYTNTTWAKTIEALENGISFGDYRGWQQDIQGLKNDGEKRRILAETDFPDSVKEALYEMDISDGHEKRIQAVTGAGLSFNDFLDIQSTYALYNAEDSKASEKALEFSRWVDEQGYTEEQEKAIRDNFVFFAMSPAQESNYDKFTSAGLSEDKAYKLHTELAALEPLEGADKVTEAQKLAWTAFSSDYSSDEKYQALSVLMGDSYAKVKEAQAQGISVEAFMDFYINRTAIKANKGEDGKPLSGKKDGSKQHKIGTYIDQIPGLTPEQKDYLYKTIYETGSNLDRTPWHGGAPYTGDLPEHYAVSQNAAQPAPKKTEAAPEKQEPVSVKATPAAYFPAGSPSGSNRSSSGGSTGKTAASTGAKGLTLPMYPPLGTGTANAKPRALSIKMPTVPKLISNAQRSADVRRIIMLGGKAVNTTSEALRRTQDGKLRKI